MITINNIKLLNKVKELASNQTPVKREKLKIMMQIAVIRKAFGVKNDEHEQIKTEWKDYERVQVQTDYEIIKNFNDYLGFLKWAIETKNEEKEYEFKNQVNDYIEAVNFFNKWLADELRSLS